MHWGKIRHRQRLWMLCAGPCRLKPDSSLSFFFVIVSSKMLNQILSGIIRTALANMDREVKEEYQVLLQAKDMGGQLGGLASTTIINITLTDVNDNPPHFTKSNKLLAMSNLLMFKKIYSFIHSFIHVGLIIVVNWLSLFTDLSYSLRYFSSSCTRVSIIGCSCGTNSSPGFGCRQQRMGGVCHCSRRWGQHVWHHL